MAKKLRNDSPDVSAVWGDHFSFVQSVFTPESVAWLISRLEKRTRRKIEDHELFRHNCEIYVCCYLRRKAIDNSPTPKQYRIAWERMKRHFDGFRAEFDRLVDSINPHLEYREPFVDESGNSYTEGELIDRVQEDVDQFDRKLQGALREASIVADGYQQGGRRKPLAFDGLIHFLGEIYYESVGLRPGTSREVEDGGPFVAFIRDILKIIEPDIPKRRALAQTIRASLKRDRASGG